MATSFDRKLAAYQRLALFVEVCRPDLACVLETAALHCGVGKNVGWRKREEKARGNKARAKNPAFEIKFGARQ